MKSSVGDIMALCAVGGAAGRGSGNKWDWKTEVRGEVGVGVMMERCENVDQGDTEEWEQATEETRGGERHSRPPGWVVWCRPQR